MTFGVGVSGVSLVDGNSNPLVLQGVSVSGPEHNPSEVANGNGFDVSTPADAIWTTGFLPDQTTIDAMKAWGINCVRIPLNEWCWLGLDTVPGGNTMPPNLVGTPYQTQILDFVDLLAANEMYAILDDHWYDATYFPGFCDNGDLCNGQGSGPSSITTSFWQSVAAACVSRPLVLFELICEPTNQYIWNNNTANWADGGAQTALFLKTATNAMYTEATLRTLTNVGWNAVIAAIRAVPATNVILLPGVNFEQDIEYATATEAPDPDNGYTLTPITAITDSASQLALAVHWYPTSGLAFSPDGWDTQVNYSSIPAPGASNFSLPLVVCEFGETFQDSPIGLSTEASTLPGTLTVDAAIPVDYSPSTFPLPSAAKVASLDLPHPDLARDLSIDTVAGDVVYDDIAGADFTAVTGHTGAVAAGKSINYGDAVDQFDRIGFTLNFVQWWQNRRGAAAGTQTGARNISPVAWNWNEPGFAGPELIADWSGNPTNYGRVVQQAFEAAMPTEKILLTANTPGATNNGDTITAGPTDVAAALGFTANPDTFAGGGASTYPDPQVSGIQGHPVASIPPAEGDVLVFNGAEYVPSPGGAGGFPVGPLDDGTTIYEITAASSTLTVEATDDATGAAGHFEAVALPSAAISEFSVDDGAGNSATFYASVSGGIPGVAIGGVGSTGGGTYLSVAAGELTLADGGGGIAITDTGDSNTTTGIAITADDSADGYEAQGGWFASLTNDDAHNTLQASSPSGSAVLEAKATEAAGRSIVGTIDGNGQLVVVPTNVTLEVADVRDARPR